MPDRGDVSESGAASTGRRKPGGGASRSKQAPIPYATVVYGDGLSTLCNLDARLSHVLEYYQERVGHPKIDFITADKWMVVNAQVHFMTTDACIHLSSLMLLRHFD